MHKAYYKQYRQLELEHWWLRGREHILKTIIRHKLDYADCDDANCKKILNVGAATGRTSEWLTSFGDVSSVEYSAECARMAEQFTKMPITVASAEDLPYPDHHFDLVTAFDVIEHIEDHSLAVSELLRVTKPAGNVLVTVPAFPLLWSEHDEINQHYRRYSRGQLLALFSNSVVLQHGYFNSILLPPIAAARLLSRATASLHSKDEKAPKSDFERTRTSFLDPLFATLMRFEGTLIRLGLRLPAGVSEYIAVSPKEHDIHQL